MIRIAIFLVAAATVLAACATPRPRADVRYDDDGCAWVYRPGQPPSRLVSAATGEPFCVESLRRRPG